MADPPKKVYDPADPQSSNPFFAQGMFQNFAPVPVQTPGTSQNAYSNVISTQIAQTPQATPTDTSSVLSKIAESYQQGSAASAMQTASVKAAKEAQRRQTAQEAAETANRNIQNKIIAQQNASNALLQSSIAGLQTAAAQTQAGYSAGGSTTAATTTPYTGSSSTVMTGMLSNQRQTIVKEAQKYVGRPYKWGGTNPNTSFDCSGLVQWAYKKAGIKVPRLASYQALSGTITAVNKLQAGDLVAWNLKGNSRADHIAIYVGNGYIIEAPRPGKNIRLRKLGAHERGIWGVKIF